MSVKKFKIFLISLICLLSFGTVDAGSVRKEVEQANKLYGSGAYTEAIEKYDQVLVDSPGALEPKFNKANSFYRLEDYSQAIDLYREVASESKISDLAAKAKYNLGNCHYQQGLKHCDSDLQKAIDELKISIANWRSALDLTSDNEKAGRNIEVARLMIKDLLGQLKNQQDPNQASDPNQQQQGQEQQDQQEQERQADKKEDPNQQQKQEQQQSDDPNQQQEKEDPKQEEEQAPDMTAQAILDKEQQEQKEKQNRQRGQWQGVERDW